MVGRLSHSHATRAGTFIRTSPDVTLVHPDLADESAAWRLFVERPDKRYSLTDCVSFVIMRRLKLTTALALTGTSLRRASDLVPETVALLSQVDLHHQSSVLPSPHEREEALMALNIKNAEVERLAEEIAAMTGESKTQAIRSGPRGTTRQVGVSHSSQRTSGASATLSRAGDLVQDPERPVGTATRFRTRRRDPGVRP